jgi:hypothetical protein
MLEKFARYPLTFGPTPIEKLARLTEHHGGDVEIYAKRDDCNSGLAFGGNKLRKLEYIIPDAIASGADTLVSIGGVQSNHTRMVAAVAAKIGFKCRLVQESWVPHEDAVYDRVGNIMLSRIMGADVRLVDDGFDIGIRDSWKNAIAEVEAAGQAHSFELLAMCESVPPAEVAARMAPLPTGPLVRIETLHRADGAPFALERRWLNPAAVPGSMPDLARVTVNEWLLSTVPYATGEIDFSAEAAGPDEARLLDCASGAALFAVERVTRTEAAPVTWVRLLHAPGYRMRTVI